MSRAGLLLGCPWRLQLGKEDDPGGGQGPSCWWEEDGASQHSRNPSLVDSLSRSFLLTAFCCSGDRQEEMPEDFYRD